MGSKPSSQTNSQSTYAPPQNVLDAYNNAIGRAKTVSHTPYESYSGELVAPVNGQQQTGIGTINATAGVQDPYNTAAQGLAGLSAGAINPTQFSGQQISQYESPYQQDVINATLAQINNQNAQQQSALKGNAISAGAFGGDRAGVAQAALAGQQALATNSTLANLNNQNYQQALSEFNNQQQTQLGAEQNTAARQLAAGQVLGGLGQTAQQEGLAQGAAQLGAGTLMQQTQQAQDTAAYNQFLQKQAYPFQTTSWYANLLQGLGTSEGGSNTGTQTTESSSLTPILGGLVGLGSFLARGGAVPHRAAGGGLGGGILSGSNIFDPTQGAMPGLGGGSYVPAPSMSMAHTMPQTSGMGASPSTPSLSSDLSQMSSIAKGVQGLGNGVGGLFGNNGSGDYSQAGAALYGLQNGLGMSDIGFARGGLAGAAFRNGGVVLGDGGLMGRPHYDDGGAISSDALLFDPGALDAVGTGLKPGIVGHDGTGLVAPQATPPSPVTAAPPPVVAPPQSDAPAKAPVSDPTFNRMIGIESGGKQLNPDGTPVTSPKGAIGIAQVMPGTGPEAATYAGLPWDENKYRTDPDYNLALGKAYYQHQLQEFGSPDKAAAAYNAGPGALKSALAQAAQNGGSYLNYLPAETQAYVAKVMGTGNSGQPNTALAYTDQPAQPSGGALGAIGRFLNGSSALSGTGNAGSFLDRVTGASDASHPGLLGLNLSDNQRLGLLAAGLGIMAGKSLNVGQNIGEGGLAGIQAMMNAPKTAADVGLKRAQTQAVTTESQIKQQQLNLMLNALEKNAALFGSSAKSAASSAAPSGTGTSGVNVTPPAPSAKAPSAAATAPTASAAPAKTIDPQYDPLRLRQAAENMSFVNPQAAANYRDQAAQIEQGKALVRFTDGSYGFMPGYNEAAAGQEAAKETAKQDVGAAHDLVEVPDPNGGPSHWVRKSDVLASTGQGSGAAASGVGAGSPPGGNAGVIAHNPAFIAKAQDQIATDEQKMADQFHARQLGRQRLQTLQNIMQNYQTGAFADHKADMIAALRGVGINVPNTATANPEAFQEFVKNATANVFDQVKSMGGKILLAEIEGLKKANSNPEMQPGANAAIINQALGILDHEDKYYQDYASWKKANPYAYNIRDFDIPWNQSHPVDNFVKQRERNFAYQGQTIPAPAQREMGQAYMTPKGPMRWAGSGWAPIGATP